MKEWRTKEPVLSHDEIEVIKRQIETQLDEYEQAVAEAAEWWRAYQARQPKGFRATRRTGRAMEAKP